jgi:succinate-semialdehyde dehydrogenase / glutarate-semialdehyde dehydrogenase
MKNLVSINPYTQAVLKSYPQVSEDELQLAVNQAQNSFLRWKDTGFSKKAELFKNLAEILRSEKSQLGLLATSEMGKPLVQAIAEVEKCATVCDYYIQNTSKFLAPKIIETDGVHAEVHHQALGCILGVMPWNFPFWQVLRFAVPTIMAGNVVILKHASNVSGCALKIEELFLQAGFPKGIFTTLLMSSDRVSGIIADPKIKGVSLTGSTEAGKKVAEVAGRYLKKLVLELGGSDPYLVLEKANIKWAAETCMKSRLQNNGQSCIAAKRFVVHESIYEEFKNEILNIAKSVSMGDPSLKTTQLGPIARFDLKQELDVQVQKCLKEGASLLFQGDSDKSSCFYPVTILENITKNNSGYLEEFFGPVVLLFKVKSTEEAVEIANATPFGLGAAVFTEDLVLAQDIAINKINSGNCFINTMVRSDPKLPFGGINESGYGRELSSHGLLEFVNTKSVGIKK